MGGSRPPKETDDISIKKMSSRQPWAKQLRTKNATRECVLWGETKHGNNLWFGSTPHPGCQWQMKV